MSLKLLGMDRAWSTLLNTYLTRFPCVALLGVRQCGKTTLLRGLPKPWKIFDLDRRADADVVGRDPDTFFRLNPRYVALDEIQNTVKRVVKHPRVGSHLLAPKRGFSDGLAVGAGGDSHR